MCLVLTFHNIAIKKPNRGIIEKVEGQSFMGENCFYSPEPVDFHYVSVWITKHS